MAFYWGTTPPTPGQINLGLLLTWYLDFGLATTNPVTCTGPNDFMGTMAYQGPELPMHSPAGDMWALGACIHHMAIGGPPISHAPPHISDEQWIEDPRARRVVPAQNMGYTRDLDIVLSRVLRKDPRRRPQGKALMDMIQDVINGWEADWVQLNPAFM